jgi:large subunit ribosomal protein L1
MPKHGKKYRTAIEKVDQDRLYDATEAIELAKEIAFANFDETLEVHLRTGLDPRHAEQQVRGSTVLPNGLGKEQRVIVFVEGEGSNAAREAGADEVGSDELVQKIQGGWLEFDVAIASRDQMGKVGSLGRVLGPRGLMPNPRTGTVVAPEDIGRAVREAKQGRVEYRVDRLKNIHVPFGKVSFDTERLTENLATVLETIQAARPNDFKGTYVHNVAITSTMGPGIPVDPRVMTTLRTG